MSDESIDGYDVLTLPVHIGGIINRENNTVKPFLGIYFPVELLKKIGWTRATYLKISVEDGFLKNIPVHLEYLPLNHID